MTPNADGLAWLLNKSRLGSGAGPAPGNNFRHVDPRFPAREAAGWTAPPSEETPIYPNPTR